MPDAVLDGMAIMLCDWRGRCVWQSDPNALVKIGDEIWEHAASISREPVKTALGKAITAREFQTIEVFDSKGILHRARLWPLESPDVAVCILHIRLPAEVAKLSKRERECLELLAQGMETGKMATCLDVSVSTIHSHLKQARETLNLDSLDALRSFAARFFYPSNMPLSPIAVLPKT